MTHRGPFQPLPLCDSVMGNKREQSEAIVQLEKKDRIAIMESWWDDLPNGSATTDGY